MTPVQGGDVIDLARFGQLGKDGRPGTALRTPPTWSAPAHAGTERKVGGEAWIDLFKGCEKRIIVTTFASNVQRLQQIINVAPISIERKVAITGRSMENMSLKVAARARAT